MEKPHQQDKEIDNFVHAKLPVYESREALEEARLRVAINRTDTEKFKLFTRMIRITIMLGRAKIIHK